MRFLQVMLTAFIFALVAPVGAWAQDVLDGRYLGMADAEGASISIRPDSAGYRGTFFDAKGNRQEFSADRNGDSAEAVLDMDGRTVFMRMTPLPFGAEVALVPFGPDGALAINSARIVNFVREGLDIPTPPKDFVPPPQGTGERIAAYSFLVSYEFWPPAGVRDGYLSLSPRNRTLIRLFPAVQLDVIWKLCLAPAADAALGHALRGQGVTCPEVIEGIAAAQRSGKFDDYKKAVKEQGDQLRNAVRCGDRYVLPQATCDRAAKQVSEAAISLETAGTVLRRYR